MRTLSLTAGGGVAKTTSSKVNLSRNDYRILVSWIEVEANFSAVHGSSGGTVVGAKLRKKDAFELMVKHLKSKTQNKALRDLTARNMQQRWITYMRRFRSTLKASDKETGLGLTKQELEHRMSIPEKLERICPEFQRMKVLFGQRTNITPSSTVELGAPNMGSFDADEKMEFDKSESEPP
ncbi:hypothetical protein PHYPSEUDO_003582 [Phytophthora pseudosyringae]|uniref:Uncharacterized protein n=1 Tax=Phytophthora pseudosyringae TaxID=221518 RepID=A0A8T1VQB0_9STRA|nr:hypothetical protein PHYPSEUDO_003582 [Phytophthora pseudosyringae]